MSGLCNNRVKPVHIRVRHCILDSGNQLIYEKEIGSTGDIMLIKF